ncbi:hypothetical protein SAMN02910447_00918 [Ruminococcus sp. YE71]|uniref:hypothetical protein n=1 Tax=unclassified Ruminococcus TaxID=2608920 RepID=UPI000888BBDD|nr:MULTISPECIES: hypothetical protein [unclassified Ruminococcus]SDA15387.1 hypothetical protein SAMN02910446_00917 [Ruminococcus sp. YE78]SFW22450.1 hypothetical protein SAMN02910447_00918 [Ruminococcus sp. YE71]
MFGLFRKKAENDSPLKKRVRDMKCRKISYVDCDFDELCAKMRQSPEAILSLTPVNYYAVKNEYILALVYTSPDYSENYVQLKRISFEKQCGQSEIYALDSSTVSRALAKVGIIIDLPKQ